MGVLFYFAALATRRMRRREAERRERGVRVYKTWQRKLIRLAVVAAAFLALHGALSTPPRHAGRAAVTTTTAAPPATAPGQGPSEPGGLAVFGVAAAGAVALAVVAGLAVAGRRRPALQVAVEPVAEPVRVRQAVTTAGPQRVAQGPPPMTGPATEPGAAVADLPGILTEDLNRHDEQLAVRVPVEAPVGGELSGKAPAPAPVVYLLGPVQISPCLETVTSKKVLELCSFLASHRDRPYSADDLCTVLWLPESDRGGLKTVRNYVSRLRRSIGAEYFPQGGDGGYALSPEVRTDIDLFDELVEAARSSLPVEARGLLRRALDLVRSEPFGKIGESWVSDERLVEPVELAIVRTARQLVRISIEAGDIETAYFAVDCGLLVSNDYGLYEDLLRVAAATSDGRALDKAWARVCRLLGEEPHLMALAAELRRPLRQAPARTRVGHTSEEQARLQ